MGQALYQQAAVYILNEDSLPFFEAHGTQITTILSDSGHEFCSRPDQHPYDLLLQLEGIEHRTAKVRRPQSNGFVERLCKTLLDEHFRIMGRTKWYESTEEMQNDLDTFMHHYNHERAHQGRNMKGRAPHKAFMGGLSKNEKTGTTEKQAA